MLALLCEAAECTNQALPQHSVHCMKTDVPQTLSLVKALEKEGGCGWMHEGRGKEVQCRVGRRKEVRVGRGRVGERGGQKWRR